MAQDVRNGRRGRAEVRHPGPDLAAFASLTRGIQLELVTTDEELDLKKREADVAIRLTPTPPEYAVGKRILTPGRSVYASHTYIEQHDSLNNPEKVHWIGWDDTDPAPQWIKDSKSPNTPVHHQSGKLHVQIEAAKSDLGLAMLSCFIGDAEPELQRLSSETSNTCGDIWILTHKDLRNAARVRAFINLIVIALDKHRDLIEGRQCTQTPVTQKSRPTPRNSELTLA